MRPKLVFTGPTLSHADALKVVDAVCLPPAVQGSIVSAVQRFDPSAILIIDGGFQAEPAVRHKEILWAIAKGVPVVGAASMGALRAAELFPYMQGVGLIYRWYRRFAFAPDDAVAVLHGPWEVNSAPITHALIDLRMTVRWACRRGFISAEYRTSLERAAQALNFRERTLSRMVGDALSCEGNLVVEKYQEILAAAFVQQKKQDARDALRLLDHGLFKEPAPLPDFQLTVAFFKDLDEAGLEI
ncbi:MAG: TfuA domain-containing protein [Mesorhizobium sp.]|uniref:TfuA-like protein n=1 Tax=Mesorhizobium sp. TaxID=1871066 RepID=UPI000FEA5753|nr:TfuA-like protein [Mesorhizobium sp.]RWQ38391.1 MAG: TfuA domain-containing protein [Mesorhizobium sp.]TIL23479.1 MAG: TfuA domain-containing protein [Mesorhizobium sp.]